MIEALIKSNRSCRRFDEAAKIERLQIVRWLSVVRQTASMRNAQPLKYIIITDPTVCNELTAHQNWAGLLKDWAGPAEGERPTAYLIQILDTDLAPSARFDEGIQVQTLGLLATEAGYAICAMQPYSTAEIARTFELPAHHSVNCVIALGKPLEERVLEEVHADDIHYWRDAAGVHHVPKRAVEDLIIEPNARSLF